ncbi:MAG: universal stress protein [Pseudomonadota bacterium]
MTYTTLLVNVGTEGASDARIRLAEGLAAQFGAALVGMAAQPVIVPVTYDGDATFTMELFAQEEDRVVKALGNAERHFRSALPTDIAAGTEWHSFREDAAGALIREARSADLIVLGVCGAAGVGDVLMAAGRPVLLVPASVGALRADSVVVAWRDTAQARRAVTDALPLLRRAQSVLVLELLDRESASAQADGAGVEAVVGLLKRHGVAARGEARPVREATVADGLIQAARDEDADLIVAGGYGHARLREWAFGGVTRDLMTKCPLCCLMSH